MAQVHDSMMNPKIEDLLSKVDSKFTLVSLGSLRARQINSYFGQLGDGLGSNVPPQVTSVARKPLSIAFEEIAADKIVAVPIEADVAEGDAASRRLRRLAEPVPCWPGAPSFSASPEASRPTRPSRSAAAWSTPVPTWPRC